MSNSQRLAINFMRIDVRAGKLTTTFVYKTSGGFILLNSSDFDAVLLFKNFSFISITFEMNSAANQISFDILKTFTPEQIRAMPALVLNSILAGMHTHRQQMLEFVAGTYLEALPTDAYDEYILKPIFEPTIRAFEKVRLCTYISTEKYQ